MTDEEWEELIAFAKSTHLDFTLRDGGGSYLEYAHGIIIQKRKLEDSKTEILNYQQSRTEQEIMKTESRLSYLKTLEQHLKNLSN